LDLVPEIVFQWLLWFIAATGLLHLQENAAPAMAAPAQGGFVRDLRVYASRSETVVWEYPILTLSMAAMVKFAALPKVFCRNCKQLLRQQHG
jgi:hypothetical protein